MADDAPAVVPPGEWGTVPPSSPDPGVPVLLSIARDVACCIERPASFTILPVSPAPGTSRPSKGGGGPPPLRPSSARCIEGCATRGRVTPPRFASYTDHVYAQHNTEDAPALRISVPKCGGPLPPRAPPPLRTPSPLRETIRGKVAVHKIKNSLFRRGVILLPYRPQNATRRDTNIPEQTPPPCGRVPSPLT